MRSVSWGWPTSPGVWKAPPGTADHTVDSRHRHQLFLAFKEALTNVVRHSGASEVRLSIQVEQGQVRLTIADNGRGFSPGIHDRGNGRRGQHAGAH